MIAKNTDSFVLGEDAYPEWFKEFNDRVQYSTDPISGELSVLTIINSSGPVKAHKDDVLARLGTDILVIPKDAAERYMK